MCSVMIAIEYSYKLDTKNDFNLWCELGRFLHRQSHIAAKDVLAPLHSAVEKFHANVLKCKVHFKTKVKCIFVTMCSLVMSTFSRDFIKTEID